MKGRIIRRTTEMSPERVLRQKVWKEMGLVGKGSLKKLSMPEVQRRMEPFAEEKYPVRMAGDRSKVPLDYSLAQWGHPKKLMEAFMLDPEIRIIVKRTPNAKALLERYIRLTLPKRGLRGYEGEWKALSPADIKAIVKSPSVYSNQANKLNAGIAAREARKKIAQTQKGCTIVDLGSGAGGTILPIIEKLNPIERSRIRIDLFDIMQVGLNEARNRLEKLGLKENQITTIKSNLGKMLQKKETRELIGKADIVVSGASLHHVSDINPEFKAAFKLLKKGGMFCFWDWGHYAWRAPNLIIAPEGTRVSTAGKFYEKGRRTIEAPKETAFIGRQPAKGVSRGRIPLEVQTVKEMLATWVTLLKYPPEYRQKFEQYFERAARRREPINFAEWLKGMTGVPTIEGKKAGIQFFEGHRPLELYLRAIKKAGFKRRPHAEYPTQSDLLYQIVVRK